MDVAISAIMEDGDINEISMRMKEIGALDESDQDFETPTQCQVNSAFVEKPAAERLEQEEDDVSAEIPSRRNPGRAAKFDGKYTN